MKALTLEHNGHKILAFQTGRRYQRDGQIILVKDMGDYLLMSDISRTIDYAFPLSVGLDAHRILDEYDSIGYGGDLVKVDDWSAYYSGYRELQNVYDSGACDSLKLEG